MTPLEKASAIIWYGAAGVSEVDSLHERVEKLEAAQDQYEHAQATDESVNKQVEALAKEMAWVSFHHHDGRAIGHDHEHELTLGRGHVDGN